MRSGLSVFKLPLRQRRTLFLLLAAILSYLLLFGVGLSSSKSFSGPGVSPDYFNSTSKVNEIYGLIHLATSGKAKHDVLYTHVADPTTPIDLSIYADGKDINWESEVSRLNTRHPIVVFSELYCPYSRRAKKVLLSYHITPEPYIVELDMRDDASIMRALLTRLTGRSTLPNILLQGKSIGGCDEVLALHKVRGLEKVLQEAGAVVKRRGS